MHIYLCICKKLHCDTQSKGPTILHPKGVEKCDKCYMIFFCCRVTGPLCGVTCTFLALIWDVFTSPWIFPNMGDTSLDQNSASSCLWQYTANKWGTITKLRFTGQNIEWARMVSGTRNSSGVRVLMEHQMYTNCACTVPPANMTLRSLIQVWPG